MVNITPDLSDTIPYPGASFDAIVRGRRKSDRPVRVTPIRPQFAVRRRARHAVRRSDVGIAVWLRDRTSALGAGIVAAAITAANLTMLAGAVMLGAMRRG